MAENQKSKEKMIQVAIDLFSARGFKGTSIRDIAQAMNMSISNIYHYFGNKDGLMLAILKHSSKGLSEKLRQISEMDMEPLDRFKQLIKMHIELSESYKKEFKIFFLDEEHLSPESEKINQQVQREILDLYCKSLQALKDSGQLHCKKITITAFNILGVINWHLRWYRPEGPLSQKEVTNEVMSFVLYGVLGARPCDAKSDNRPIE